MFKPGDRVKVAEILNKDIYENHRIGWDDAMYRTQGKEGIVQVPRIKRSDAAVVSIDGDLPWYYLNSDLTLVEGEENATS